MTKSNPKIRQTGQSMVEYTVILVALTMAVLAVGDGDFSTPEDSNIDELRQAIDFNHRGYTYAVSLSEYPESEDLAAIADYYDSLGKHPELADQMRGGVSTIKSYVTDYVETTSYFQDFDPDLPDDFEDIDIGAIIRDLSGF